MTPWAFVTWLALSLAMFWGGVVFAIVHLTS